jgi:hypothetical protein
MLSASIPSLSMMSSAASSALRLEISGIFGRAKASPSYCDGRRLPAGFDRPAYSGDHNQMSIVR